MTQAWEVQDLRLHDEVVVHTRRGGIKRVAGGDVQAHAVAVRHLVLQRDAHVLGVVPLFSARVLARP